MSTSPDLSAAQLTRRLKRANMEGNKREALRLKAQLRQARRQLNARVGGPVNGYFL